MPKEKPVLLEAITNTDSAKNLVNQAVGAAQRVTSAIRQASARAGVDFAYMLNKATQESGLDPKAKAATSSASGLFQFIEQTWLRTVKTFGDKYGMGDAANRITIGADGVARVSDSKTKQAILNLRNDPAISANMAAELTKQNKTALQSEVGGKIGSTELYLAHFLGAGGAAEFLKSMQSNPNASAAGVLPDAAAANRGVFYDKMGAPRTLTQIYDHFAQKFNTVAPAATSTMIADAAPVMQSLPSTLNVMTSGFTTALESANQYVPSGAGSSVLDKTMSSPFATMMLAQMDVGVLSETKMLKTVSDEEQKKKSSIRTLGATA